MDSVIDTYQPIDEARHPDPHQPALLGVPSPGATESVRYATASHADARRPRPAVLTTAAVAQH